MERTQSTRHLAVFYAVMLAVIYLGVPLLIFFGLIPWDMKFVALTAGAIVVYFAMRISGSSNEDLGLTVKRTKQSIRYAIPVTVVLLALSLVFLLTQGARFAPTETLSFYVFYVLISCPAQELLFRGALSQMMKAYALPRFLELVAASLLFAYVHFIYRDPLTVAAMAVVGFFWYRAYQKSDNLLGVTLSHIILGVLTIALGIVD
jgi:membrane protease YdiL (CAAX protease family)